MKWRGSTVRKLVVGFLAVGPLTYTLLFFLVIFPAFAAEIRADEDGPGDVDSFRERFAIVASVHMSMVAISVLSLAYFLHHLYRSSTRERESKVLWSVALIFGNVFAFPAFYYFVWLRD